MTQSHSLCRPQTRSPQRPLTVNAPVELTPGSERPPTHDRWTRLRCGIAAPCVLAVIWLSGCTNMTPRFPQSVLPSTLDTNAAGVGGATGQPQGQSPAVVTAGHVQSTGETQAVGNPGSAAPASIPASIPASMPASMPANAVQPTSGEQELHTVRQYPNTAVPQPPPTTTTTQGGAYPYQGSMNAPLQNPPASGGTVYSYQQPVAPPAPVTNSTTTFPPTQFGPRTPVNSGTGVIPGLGPAYPPYGTDPVYSPTVREADLIINGFPARTGRIMFGGAVNSDAGVTGQITIDERNFDICRWPRSFQDLFSGTAFRGAGQTFRIEAAPGSDFDRYSAQWATPNLFGYLPLSFSVSGFLFDRRYDDWDENRLGMQLSYGYRITPDLSLTFGFDGQRVKVDNPRATVPIFDNAVPPNVIGFEPIDDLKAVTGDNRKTELYSGSIGLTHNTRDTPIQPSAGHYFEFEYEYNFGDFEYSQFDLEFRQYWLLRSRADGSGKQTISYSTQVGFSGDDTPIFDRYFAGGYATLRGFDFRGVGPRDAGINSGGLFQWVNSVEYMFPITADDAFRGVAFCDFGTVEPKATIDGDNFRVAPGFGLRIAIPALGPAPLAFDYAIPVESATGDEERPFSFYMSVIR